VTSESSLGTMPCPSAVLPTLSHHKLPLCSGGANHRIIASEQGYASDAAKVAIVGNRRNFLESVKEFRHNFPAERARIAREIETAWKSVESLGSVLAAPVLIDAASTTQALNEFKAAALDGYELFLLQAARDSGITQIGASCNRMRAILQPFTSCCDPRLRFGSQCD